MKLISIHLTVSVNDSSLKLIFIITIVSLKRSDLIVPQEGSRTGMSSISVSDMSTAFSSYGFSDCSGLRPPGIGCMSVLTFSFCIISFNRRNTLPSINRSPNLHSRNETRYAHEKCRMMSPLSHCGP